MNSIDILAKLIAFPTVSSEPTTDLIDFAAAFLAEQGARVEILKDGADKQSLWARFGADETGGVMLAGHVDVVPTEGQAWTKEPFQMTEEDGKLYGRGSCDMKGFVACILALSQEFRGRKLLKPVHIVLTHNEEVDMDGAKQVMAWAIEKKIKPDWGWLGEPTSLEVVHTHKGIYSYMTEVTGIPAHSSLPDDGVNAIELAAELCVWVRQLTQRRKDTPIKDSPFDPPYSSFNVGKISGGKANNIIADHCTFSWECRLHPGDKPEDYEKEFQTFTDDLMAPYKNKFPKASVKFWRKSFFEALRPIENNVATAILCSLTGNGEPLGVSYATEGSFYQNLGMPVVVCGPGSIKQAHQPDEFVLKDEIEACDRLLMDALKRAEILD